MKIIDKLLTVRNKFTKKLAVLDEKLKAKYFNILWEELPINEEIEEVKEYEDSPQEHLYWAISKLIASWDFPDDETTNLASSQPPQKD